MKKLLLLNPYEADDYDLVDMYNKLVEQQNEIIDHLQKQDTIINEIRKGWNEFVFSKVDHLEQKTEPNGSSYFVTNEVAEKKFDKWKEQKTEDRFEDGYKLGFYDGRYASEIKAKPVLRVCSVDETAGYVPEHEEQKTECKHDFRPYQRMQSDNCFHTVILCRNCLIEQPKKPDQWEEKKEVISDVLRLLDTVLYNKIDLSARNRTEQAILKLKSLLN